MQPNTFSINLDLINHEYVLVDGIKVTSGDTEANVFNINLIRDFVPVNLTGITAVIVFSKPDRKIVYQNLTPVDLTTGKFTCTLSSQTIAVPGEVKSEVVLYEGTKRLTSTRFKFIVNKGLLDETAVESSNEFSALTEALGTVNQYDGRIATVEQDQATHKADLVTDADGAHGLKIEQGTFTATLRGDSTAGTFTTTINNCKYIKIGKYVYVNLNIRITVISEAVGNFVIGGLPFAPNSNYPVIIDRYRGITMPEGYTQLAGYANPANDIWLQSNGSGKTANLNIGIAVLNPTVDIFMSCAYIVN